MTVTDRRLIEDYLPTREISAEAARETAIRHGHISTLHLWWARRPHHIGTRMKQVPDEDQGPAPDDTLAAR